MSEKLTSMKCIHLNPDETDISNYFYKRGFRTLYTQPKFNGIRALWYHEDGLYSRGGHLIISVPHIVAGLELFFPNTDLDGELYHPTMSFNDINGAARRIKPTSSSLKLEYHVFDRLVEDISQQNRLALNKFDLTRLPRNSFIKKVPTNEVTPGHLDFAFRLYLKREFEGMVVRAPDSFYRPGRHVGNLWAIKPVYETEATFLGFIDGETDFHSATFGSILLKLPNGRTFSCSGFTESEREKLFRDKQFTRGAEVTIKFGAWSHK
jgi:ATP-dependent DNA ligase